MALRAPPKTRNVSQKDSLLCARGNHRAFAHRQLIPPYLRITTADLSFTKLTPEQSRRLASAPGLRIEGFLSTPENREFFASRGMDLDRLSLGEQAEGRRDDAAPGNFHRPGYLPLEGEGHIRILVVEPGTEDAPL